MLGKKKMVPFHSNEDDFVDNPHCCRAKIFVPEHLPPSRRLPSLIVHTIKHNIKPAIHHVTRGGGVVVVSGMMAAAAVATAAAAAAAAAVTDIH